MKAVCLKPSMAPKPVGMSNKRLASKLRLMIVAIAASWGLFESALIQVVKMSAGFLESLYLIPSKKKVGKELSASINSRILPLAFLAPRFL